MTLIELQNVLTAELKKVIKEKLSSNENTLEGYRVQIKLAYNSYIDHVSLNWNKISVENRPIIEERITKFQSRVGIAYSKLNAKLSMFSSLFDKLEYTISSGETGEKSELDEYKEHSQIDNNLEKNISTMESTDFLKLASSTINKSFGGEPSQLPSFINAIRLLESMATTEALKTLLVSFIKTRLENRAIEFVNEEHITTALIIETLTKNIKFDSSKVIEGRLLSIKYGNNSSESFAKKAEELSVELRRSLINEGMTASKATEITIDKTIELCRNNTSSDLVKSVLESSKFENPKEVIAQLIVQNEKSRKETQIFSYNYDTSKKQNGYFTKSNNVHKKTNRYNNNNNNRYSNNNRFNSYNNRYNKPNNVNHYWQNKSQKKFKRPYHKNVRYFAPGNEEDTQDQNRALRGQNQPEDILDV
jgi:hypothetical protein